MGAICDLRLIDHKRVVEDGRRAVDCALCAKNPAILRAYIASLPRELNPAAIALREERLARLRQVEAPAMIIENEERHLAEAKGESYTPDALALLSMDQLRETLGRWNWANWSYSLDKAWFELGWFLQPSECRGDEVLYQLRPEPGEPPTMLLDLAYWGAEPSPCDHSGAPVRTCGTNRPDCFGYNDPDLAAEIDDALDAIDPATWSEALPLWTCIYLTGTSLSEDEIADTASQDLRLAQDAFRVLRQAYRDAVARGFGVACEYSL
jgi:hypothetical protein